MKQEASAGPQLSKVKASVEDATSRILLEDPSKNLKEYTDFTGKISEYLVMSTAEGGGYRLKDGVVIDFEEATGGNVSNASGSAFKKVNVDLNGTSKPNVAGVDKFEFLLSTQGLLVPQGCAAKLASNNWKVSKDYDSATCSSYTMGGTIADTIPDDEEYTPEGTKTCADGTVIPSYLSCESNPACTPTACGCGESWSALDCDCRPTPGFTKTCTGGQVWSETDCKCVTSTPPACTPKSCTGGKVWSQADCDCVPVITPEPCDPWERIQCGFRPNHEWDEATCTCNKKQDPEPCVEKDCGCGTWNSKTCKCVPADTSCPNGQEWDSTICSCVNSGGTEPEPKPCSDPGTCGCGTWDSVNCKCIPANTTCQGCAKWDSSSCSCKEPVRNCSSGQEWDDSTCSCVETSCSDPGTCGCGSWDPVNCVCIPANTTCQGCAKWDSKTCSCKEPNKSCPNGQEWDDSTCSCVKKACSDPGTCGCGTWDSVNCKCIPASKKCSGCGVWDESTCSCTPPNTKCYGCNKWDSSTCSCQPMDTSCPVGYEWSMGTCSCDAKQSNVDKTNGPLGSGGGGSDTSKKEMFQFNVKPQDEPPEMLQAVGWV